MAPHAAQTWQQILQLGKLYLKASFARCRMKAEDVENERGAVDDLNRFADGALEV